MLAPPGKCALAAPHGYLGGNWPSAQLSAPAVQAAGGRYLVAGVRPEVVEGEFDAHRVVIIEFESVERAQNFYHSATYQAAKQKRLGAADFKLLLLEG